MEKDVAILMADLTGYTAMTDVHGGASAAMLVNKYMGLVDKSLIGTTEVIQRIGDQIVLIADHPLDIVETAQKLNSLIVSEHHFLPIHAGIHFGSVFIDKGNLFGSTINIASRIMNMAEQGRILCSSSLVEKISSTSIHSFRHLGNFSFKNVMDEVTIYELETPAQKYQLLIDPVCRMQIDPTRTQYIFSYQNQNFHFCSEHCLTLFKKNPESFSF